MTGGGPAHFYEQAYDYFLARIYDDWYGDLSDKSKGPFRPTLNLMKTFTELGLRTADSVRILDCACGTGNLFAAFTDSGYDAWASDGSPEMLKKAIRNCQRLSSEAQTKLITQPIRWTDSSAFDSLRERAGLFDLIVVASNSFCHIPPAEEYMQVALGNMFDILRPGGRLLIDTKRYIKTAPVDGVPIFRELRFDDAINKWIIRSEREEIREINGRQVHFHTRLHYDVDPSFSNKLCRALVVITRYGKDETPGTMVLPYYPLPAEVLEGHMKRVKFVTTLFPAKQMPTNWSYDFVVGQKL